MRTACIPALCLSVLAAAAVGCGSRGGESAKAPPRVEEDRYFNRESSFSIVFPAGWELRERTLGVGVAALSPPADAGDHYRENLNIAVEPMPKPLDVNAYYEKVLETLRSTLTDFEVLLDGESTAGGAPTHWMAYVHTADGKRVKGLAYFFVRDDSAFEITGTALESTFGDFKPIFEEAVRSFRFE